MNKKHYKAYKKFSINHGKNKKQLNAFKRMIKMKNNKLFKKKHSDSILAEI